MRPYVDVHRVLVLEPLRADAAVVKTPLLPHPIACRRRVLDGRLLGVGVRPLVLLRGGFRARHHRSCGDRDGRAQTAQHPYLFGGNTVDVLDGGVDLAELVYGLRHFVGYSLELFEVFGVGVVELGQEDVVHVMGARWVLGVGLSGRVLFEYDCSVGVDAWKENKYIS